MTSKRYQNSKYTAVFDNRAIFNKQFSIQLRFRKVNYIFFFRKSAINNIRMFDKSKETLSDYDEKLEFQVSMRLLL